MPLFGASSASWNASLFCSGTASIVSFSRSPPVPPCPAIVVPSNQTWARPEAMCARPSSRAIRRSPLSAGSVMKRSTRSRPMSISRSGQQRPFALGWLELGRSAQDHALRRKRSNVDVAVDVRERSPIQAHLGREQKFALRVRNRQAAQHHRAVQRSLDPPHLDLEPACEPELLDLVGDEPVTRLGVEQKKRRGSAVPRWPPPRRQSTWRW